MSLFTYLTNNVRELKDSIGREVWGVKGNVRRQWSESVILLGLDECQSSKLLLD